MRWTSTRIDSSPNVGLGPRLIAAGQRSPPTQARPAYTPGGRQQRVDAGEVRRGKADLRPAAGAVRDHAANAVRLREQPVGSADVAGGDQLPDARAGDDRAVDLHRRHDVERDAGRGRQLPQPVDRAFAIVAEVKVRSFDHRLGRERAADDPLEKVLGREVEQRFVGRIGDDPIDAGRWSSSALRSVHVSGGGHCSGRSSRTGCGSNVNTIAGPPTASARSNSRRTIATCPRCTPSKLPIATAPPRASAGKSFNWRMMCMAGKESGYRRSGYRESNAGYGRRVLPCPRILTP